MSFYTDLARTASTLLKGKGQQVTILRAGATITPKWAVDLQWPATEVDTEILRGDRKVIMEVGTEPLLSDRIKIGLTICAIMDVKKIAPAGEPVIYILQARAGG